MLERAGRDRAVVGIRSTAGDPDTKVLDKGQTTQAIIAAQPADSEIASAQTPQIVGHGRGSMSSENLSTRLVEIEAMLDRSRRRFEEGSRLVEEAHQSLAEVQQLLIGIAGLAVSPEENEEAASRLLASLKASGSELPETLCGGRLAVDPIQRLIRIDGHPIGITEMEYRVLELLAFARNNVVTRQMLLKHLYRRADDQPQPKIIDVFISKLSKKLRSASGGAEFIETIPQRGWILRDIETGDRRPSHQSADLLKIYRVVANRRHDSFHSRIARDGYGSARPPRSWPLCRGGFAPGVDPPGAGLRRAICRWKRRPTAWPRPSWQPAWPGASAAKQRVYDARSARAAAAAAAGPRSAGKAARGRPGAACRRARAAEARIGDGVDSIDLLFSL